MGHNQTSLSPLLFAVTALSGDLSNGGPTRRSGGGLQIDWVPFEFVLRSFHPSVPHAPPISFSKKWRMKGLLFCTDIVTSFLKMQLPATHAFHRADRNPVPTIMQLQFIIQRSAKRLVRSCEKFIPALAYLFCLPLPGSCLARFAYLLADLCRQR